MTIPPAPLPTLGNVARVLRGAAIDAAWISAGARAVTYYGRGSFALAAAVDALRSRSGEDLDVWLPAYFCDEAADPLRARGARISYYEITRDLAPDFATLHRRLGAKSGGIFVLVHYFGFPSATQETAEFCRSHGMSWIEDAAHVARPGAVVGTAEYTIFSPRKLFAIPAIGCLLANGPGGAARIPPRLAFSVLPWLTKRVIQRSLHTLRIPWHRIGHGFTANTPARRVRPAVPPTEAWGCSSLAISWLGEQGRTLDGVVAARREHYRQLLDVVVDVGLEPLFSSLPPDVCPYALPVLWPSDVGEAAARLQRSGIPVSRWPDLPEEVLSDRDEYPMSNDIFDRLLLIPVHQSLLPRDISRISRGLLRLVGAE